MSELLWPLLGLLLCLALLLRGALPALQRSRLDAAAMALWQLLRQLPAAWRQQRRRGKAQTQARRAITQASERARKPRASKIDGPAQVHDLQAWRARRSAKGVDGRPGPGADPGMDADGSDGPGPADPAKPAVSPPEDPPTRPPTLH